MGRPKKNKGNENKFATEETHKKVRVRGVFKRDWTRRRRSWKSIPNNWELWMEEAYSWRVKNYLPPMCYIELDPPLRSEKHPNQNILVKFRREPKALIGMPDDILLSLDLKYEPWGNGLGGYVSIPRKVEIIPRG